MDRYELCRVNIILGGNGLLEVGIGISLGVCFCVGQSCAETRER